MIRTIYTVVALFIFALAGHASGAERVALVVGNGDYKKTPALENPVNDAVLISDSLRKIGFEVVDVTDGNRQAMLGAMARFGKLAQGAEVALFFYAGHGLEVAGRNWILPINADIEASSDLPVSAIKVDDVLEIMELSEARIRLIILDACRNNPLPRSLSRSASRGLAKIDASAAGTMVVFAAAPGNVALDGTGSNSPFSKAFAEHLGKPGLEVRQMIGRVRQDVMAATSSKQVPWVNEAIAGDFYLAGTPDVEDGRSDDDRSKPDNQKLVIDGDLSIELKFWDSVKDSNNKELLGIYLQQYPEGSFTELATAMIAAIDNSASAGRNTSVSNPNALSDSAAILQDMEAQARHLLQQFNLGHSGTIDDEIAMIRKSYGAVVDFHGKRFSINDIIKDKRSLFKRWPQRDYRSPDSELQIYCNPDAAYCDAESTVYWNVYSPKRNQSANGVARNTLRLDFSTGQPKIVSERSENITNQ